MYILSLFLSLIFLSKKIPRARHLWMDQWGLFPSQSRNSWKSYNLFTFFSKRCHDAGICGWTSGTSTLSGKKRIVKKQQLVFTFCTLFLGKISKKNCTCVTLKKRYHKLGICGWTSGAFYHLIKKKKRVDTNLQKRLSLFSLQRGVTLPAFLDRLEPLTLTIEKRVDFLLFLNFSTKILLHVVTFFFGKDTTSPAFVDRLEGPPAVSGGRPSAARHLSPSTLWLHLSTFFCFLLPFSSLLFS